MHVCMYACMYVCMFACVQFQDSWNEIFISERYRPKAIRFMSLIMSLYFLGSGALDWLGDPGHKGEWGGYNWTIRSSSIRPIGGILSFLTAISFFLPVFQPFCVRHNDLLCVIWLVIVYMTQMVIFLYLLIYIHKFLEMRICVYAYDVQTHLFDGQIYVS